MKRPRFNLLTAGSAIVVASATMVVALSLFSQLPSSKQAAQVLKVAFPAHHPIRHYDTASIQTSSDHNVLRNLFSPLVEFDKNGNIVGALAERWEWHEDRILFSIRPLKTVEGYKITARDAALSLKRLILRSTNTHGDLREFLCSSEELSSIHDECAGIQVISERVLSLKPKTKKAGTFLIPLLASIDFAVIPEQSIDLSDDQLKIKDFRNTTGPYFLVEDSENGAFLFEANPLHFHYSESMPQKIQFIPTKGDLAVQLFKDKKVDIITTVDFHLPSTFDELINSMNDINVHKTVDVKSWLLQFSQNGQQRFSPEQRRFIGKAIRSAYLNDPANNFIKETLEFFPVMSEGGLSAEQRVQITSLFKDQGPVEISQKVKLGVHPSLRMKYESLFSHLPFIDLIDSTAPPWAIPPDAQPDMFIYYTDSGFYEDISLISYNISIGGFGLSKEKGIEWLNQYMDTEGKATRITLLQKLHYEFLSRGLIIPIGHAPYIAVAHSPWKFDISPFYAGTPLWQIITH